jgi:hypothetical protein
MNTFKKGDIIRPLPSTKQANYHDVTKLVKAKVIETNLGWQGEAIRVKIIEGRAKQKDGNHRTIWASSRDNTFMITNPKRFELFDVPVLEGGDGYGIW